MTGDGVAVLDGHGNPEQRQVLTSPEPGIGVVRLRAGPLGPDDLEGVQPAVQPGDPVEAVLHEPARRHRPVGEKSAAPEDSGVGGIGLHPVDASPDG